MGILKNDNPYRIAQQQLEIACKYIDVEEGLVDLLKTCKREVIVSFPVRMDDGKLDVFTGYRVVHCPARGPSKGGDSLSSCGRYR